MSDPVAAAAENVEIDADPDPASPDPDQSDPNEALADLDELQEADEITPESTSLASRLMDPLEGDLREDHVGDLWNPKNGGLNRIVLVVEEAAGLSDGLPRAAHALIGAAEVYHEHADNLSLGGDSDESDSDELTIPESDL